jgi:ABC-2 type transport system permease protein
MPLLVIVFVSFAFEGLLTGKARLDLPVVDLDESDASRRLIDDLQSVESLSIKERNWSGESFDGSDAANVFDGGRKIAVLVIPKGYAADREQGSATLEFYVDPAQARSAALLGFTVQSRLQVDDFVETAVRVAAIESNQSEVAIRADVEAELARALDDPSTRLSQTGVVEGRSLPGPYEQTVPGFALMFSVFLASYVAVQITLEKKESGTWYRTLSSPVSRPVVVLGMVSSAFSLGVMQTVVLFAIGKFVFGMELGSSYIGLAATILLFQLMPAGLGLLLAGLTDNITLQSNIANLGVMFFAVLGGAMVPIFLLPSWMQIMSAFTPHFWAMQSFNDLMFRGKDLTDIAPRLAVLAAWGLVPMALGLFRFQFQRYL